MRRLTNIQNVTGGVRSKIVGTLIGLTAFSGTAHATDQIFQIDLNKTQILRLPEAAGSIIIGNPAIADVMLQSPTMILVIGRGFGETNFMVLDRNGDTIVDADVQVTSITPSNGVRLFNRSSRETYSCSPSCQPSPVMGDTAEHIAANSAQLPAASDAGAVVQQDEPAAGANDASDVDPFFDDEHSVAE